MGVFADFALLGTVPSYGGAEVLRARRYRQGTLEPPVHLALYGSAHAAERVRLIADAAGQVSHDRLGRIHEVGIHDRMLFAVADPVEGLDVAALLELHRRRRAQLDPAVALAIALAAAQLANDLQDGGDVWAAERGAGLSSMFLGGLRLDAIVLDRSGRVLVRPLAAAATDLRRPTPFRAPEMHGRGKRALAASDVFALTQLLRALVTTDPTASAAPRLRPEIAALGPVIAAGLAANADERLGLFVLVERLTLALDEVAATRSTKDILAAAVQREGLPPRDADLAISDDDKRKLRQPVVTERLWPGRNLMLSSEDFVEDSDAASTIALPRAALKGASEAQHSAVERVFTEEGRPMLSTISAPAHAARPNPPGLLDEAAASFAEDEKTLRTAQMQRLVKTNASDPPWISTGDVSLVDEKTAPMLPDLPHQAPPMESSEMESGPTIEMKRPTTDDDDEKTEG